VKREGVRLHETSTTTISKPAKSGSTTVLWVHPVCQMLQRLIRPGSRAGLRLGIPSVWRRKPLSGILPVPWKSRSNFYFYTPVRQNMPQHG